MSKVKEGCWIIGSGAHAQHYVKIIQYLQIPLTVVGRGEQSARKFTQALGIHVHMGGLEYFCNAIKEGINDASPVCIKGHEVAVKNPEFVIVCLPIDRLAKATTTLIRLGVVNILVEKPGAPTVGEIEQVKFEMQQQRLQAGRLPNVRIAYNRRFFSSVSHLLTLLREEGGATAVHFEFTERAHVIERIPTPNHIKQNWLLANSTHVIDTAMLIMFAGGNALSSMTCSKAGQDILAWHPDASRWCGSGKTATGTAFTYAADWNLPGRWRINVTSASARYELCPMEQLQRAVVGVNSGNFTRISCPLDQDDTLFKPGMLNMVKEFIRGCRDSSECALLPTLFGHAQFCRNIVEPIRTGRDHGSSQPLDDMGWTASLPLPFHSLMIAPKKILVVGAGNIGSRHLCALAQVDKSPLDVVVVEPFDGSAQIARERLSHAIRPECLVRFSFISSIEQLPETHQSCRLFAAIVATTADRRRFVVEQLLKAVDTVDHLILEKVLFQTTADHEWAMETLKAPKVNRVWVNIIRRVHPLWKKIAQDVANEGNSEFLTISVTGQNWGLCCNCFHFIDVILMLQGDGVGPLAASTENLIPGYLASKRTGFYEAFGTLSISGPRVQASMECVDAPGSTVNVVVRIKCGNFVANVEQNAGCMSLVTLHPFGIERVKYQGLLVSSTSKIIFDDLLTKGACDLPQLCEYGPLSNQVVEKLRAHFLKHGLDEAKKCCPIT